MSYRNPNSSFDIDAINCLSVRDYVIPHVG